MSARTRLALRILGGALPLGIAGDLLLRDTVPGINVFIWTLLFIGAIAAVLRLQSHTVPESTRWLAPALLLFAAAVALRDSEMLKMLDIVALVIIASLAILRTRFDLRYRLASLFNYACGLVISAVDAVIGPIVLLSSDLAWDELPKNGWRRNVMAASRGLLIAIPILVVFGALLSSADPVFDNMIGWLFDFNLRTTIEHGLAILFIAWGSAGVLYGVLMRPDPTRKAAAADMEADAVDPEAAKPGRLSLGIFETSIILGLLDLMFLVFVVIQFRYFFGGADFVEASYTLTYSEYARSGFFELVTVTALVLPILLSLHWLLRKEDPTHETIFRVLAAIQIALVLVIVVSAMGRMNVYQTEYGQTELRFYTTAFMLWLGGVLVWFAATVLRGRRERFAFGALVAGLISLTILNVINPDATIAETNIRRMFEPAGNVSEENIGRGRTLDVPYVVEQLSDDAVPVLLNHLQEIVIPTSRRAYVATILLDRQHRHQTEDDWRSWSWSRSRAMAAIEANRKTLESWRAMEPTQ